MHVPQQNKRYIAWRCDFFFIIMGGTCMSCLIPFACCVRCVYGNFVSAVWCEFIILLWKFLFGRPILLGQLSDLTSTCEDRLRLFSNHPPKYLGQIGYPLWFLDNFNLGQDERRSLLIMHGQEITCTFSKIKKKLILYCVLFIQGRIYKFN